jgi:biofilm protein TabA
MILDDLRHADGYVPLSLGIRAALAYLRGADFTQIADGKYAVGDAGVMAIVMRYKTKPPAEAVWESHRRNIDVQYVVQGRERCGYVNLECAPAVKTPYNDEKDVLFYEPGRDMFTLSAGQFAVFFPQDVHAPSLVDGEPGDVLKVVMKVPVGE